MTLDITAIDPVLINLLASFAFSILYSFIKPAGWTTEKKEKMAVVLSAAIGVGLAIYYGQRSAFDLVSFMGVAVAGSQAFYRVLWEKIGAEDVVRKVRTDTSLPDVPVVTSPPSATAAPAATAPIVDIIPWMQQANSILSAVNNGVITIQQAQSLKADLLSRYRAINHSDFPGADIVFFPIDVH